MRKDVRDLRYPIGITFNFKTIDLIVRDSMDRNLQYDQHIHMYIYSTGGTCENFYYCRKNCVSFVVQLPFFINFLGDSCVFSDGNKIYQIK